MGHFRVGRSIGRTIYWQEDDGTSKVLGMMDYPELAKVIVKLLNQVQYELEKKESR